MKLTYHVVSYESNPVPASNISVEMPGQYRGVHWRFSNTTTYPMEEPPFTLLYGSINSSPGTAPVVATADPDISVLATPSSVEQLLALNLEEKARALNLSNCHSIKKRQQSMLSRAAAEVGLASDISNYWNRIQGKVHPSFRASYTRSSVSLS